MIHNITKIVKIGRSAGVLAIAPVAGFLTILLISHRIDAGEAAKFFLLQAVTPIAGEVLGFGMADRMMREVAREPSVFPEHAHAFFGVTLAGVLPIALAFTILACTYIGLESILLIFLIIAFDAISGRILIFFEQSAIALRRVTLADGLRLGTATSRALGTAIYLLAVYNGSGLSSFGAGTAGVAVCAMIVLFVATIRLPNLLGLSLKYQRVNISFFANNLLRVAQQNGDRLVVASLLHPANFATYVVVTRILQFGILPIVSTLRQSFPDFVQSGKSGLRKLLRCAAERSSTFALSGAIGAVGVCGAGLLAPRVFGSAFLVPTNIVLLTAPILFLFSAQYLLLEVFTAIGRQNTRVAVVGIHIFMQCLFQVLLINCYGLMGAIMGLYGGLLASTIVGVSFLNKLRILDKS